MRMDSTSLLFLISHYDPDEVGRFELAIVHFGRALKLAKNVQGSQSAWSITHLNLGHAYRKSGSVPPLFLLSPLTHVVLAGNWKTRMPVSEESSNWILGAQQRIVH